MPENARFGSAYYLMEESCATCKKKAKKKGDVIFRFVLDKTLKFWFGG